MSADHPFDNLRPTNGQQDAIDAAKASIQYDEPRTPTTNLEKQAYLDSISEPGSTADNSEPKRDPVKSMQSALGADPDSDSFSDDISHTTLPMSATVDVSQQFKNAFRPRR